MVLKKANKKYVLLAMILIFICACNMSPKSSPIVTSSPKPSDTPPPTATYTPPFTATYIPVPLITSTIESTLTLGESENNIEGRYSFRPPLGYEVQIQGPEVSVFDQAGTIIISILRYDL
jgi:hypothetical protein